MISKLCYLLKELTILTKFQDNKAKIVDFSLIASFWASQKSYESPSKTQILCHFDGIYEKSGAKSIFGSRHYLKFYRFKSIKTG